MGKTFRKIPVNSRGVKSMRRPKHKHKLLAGQSPKTVVNDWDDKPIAALKESKYRIK